LHTQGPCCCRLTVAGPKPTAESDRSAAFLRELAAAAPRSGGGDARAAAALREHIDQLTREAFELRRGLTQQVLCLPDSLEAILDIWNSPHTPPAALLQLKFL